ncbi:MAG: hypothetical protein HQL22_00080 [Candidatus Omnitrophica bacterium]|nr:hypothetical protein [Candidatus Omnitrophota bacterium]
MKIFGDIHFMRLIGLLSLIMCPFFSASLANAADTGYAIQSAFLSPSYPKVTAAPGQSFTISIDAVNTQPVIALQFSLGYDPSILHLDSLTGGDATTADGQKSNGHQWIVLSNNNTPGLTIAGMYSIDSLRADGSNLEVARATFTVIKPAPANFNDIISLTNVMSDENTINNLSSTQFVLASTDVPAPVLSLIGSKQLTVGKSTTFNVYATDPNSYPLTFSSSALPVGATFNSSTKVFDWTPKADQVGVSNVTFSVYNGFSTATEAVAMTVNAAIMYGDVNSDGVIDMKDFALALRIAANGDLNGDGKVDINDVGLSAPAGACSAVPFVAGKCSATKEQIMRAIVDKDLSVGVNVRGATNIFNKYFTKALLPIEQM